MRPLRARAVLDFLQQPLLVAFLVLVPHLPLAVVVAELRLIDHGDAFLHRADGFADAAAAARLHIRVVEAVRGDVEAGVRALQPAQRTLDASVEIHYWSHRARAELLKRGVAVRL